MVSKHIIVALTLILLPFAFVRAESMPISHDPMLLVLDEDINTATPRRFRTTQDAYPTTSQKLPSRKGLEKLRACASAQFSQQSLQAVLGTLPKKLWIIDLRQETHGFVDGTPVSWYAEKNHSNVGESDDNLQKLEEMIFRDLSRQPAVRVYKIIDKQDGKVTKKEGIQLEVKEAETEFQLATRHNLGYLRIGVLDHERPEDEKVDEFIDFIKILPPDAGVYFHCRGGKGRSTTFMTLFDIWHNAHDVSLEDIVSRQALIGGIDLFNPNNAVPEWKRQSHAKRAEFVRDFYRYVKSNAYKKSSWSEWARKNI